MKPAICILTAISTSLFLSGCSTINETHLMQTQTLENVNAMRADISLLVRQSAEKQMTQAEDAERNKQLTRLRNMVDDQVASRTNFEPFLDISLPENPTDDQVTTYITDILNTSPHQHSIGQKDLQVVLLTRLGHQRLPILINMITSQSLRDYKSSSHLQYSIQNLATSSDLKLIIETIRASSAPKKGPLLNLINALHGEKEAKDVLVAELKQKMNSTNKYIDNTVLQMLVRIEDPTTYPIIIEAVAKSANIAYNYSKVKDLKGLDVEELINLAWENRSIQPIQDQLFIAQYAAQKGDITALEMLIDSLTLQTNNNYQWNPRFAVLAAIDFKGTNEEIQEWYKENSTSLTFNEETGQFSL